MLTLDSVTAGYGESMGLRDVNFTVGDGEVVALLGPNGAGKSTLLKTATGFVKPRSGRARRRRCDRQPPEQVRPAPRLPPPRGSRDLPLPDRSRKPHHPVPYSRH